MKQNKLYYIFTKLNKMTLSKAKKAILTISTIMLILPQTALALTSRQQLDQVNNEIKSVNAQLTQKRAQKDSLAADLAVIEAELKKTMLSIQASNLEISALTTEIATTEAQIEKATAEIKAQQVKMAEYLSVLYEEGNTSFIEQIFKADTFSDFVDRKEYLSQTQIKLKEVSDKIVALKKQLEAKSSELKSKKIRAESIRQSLAAKEQAVNAQKVYQAQLVAAVAAEERGLKSALNDLHARKAALSVTYGESVVRGTSSYPYGNPPPRRIIDTPDPWGYLIGECTSYVAWKRMTIGKPVPRGLGNARTWGSRAASMGLSVDRTPRVGDVMVMPYVGGYGHVAYVEAVHDAGRIVISEYNWTPFSYSTRTVNPYNYSALFIH